MMTLALNRFKKMIKSKIVLVLIATVFLSPSVSFAQGTSRQGHDNDDDQPEVQSVSPNAGPWGNSAGSTIGSADITPSTEKPVDPRLGPGGGTLGRPAGPTPDATGGPGGNPDVPFDASMNLMFLAAGIVFAFVVYRRKFKLKAVTAEKE